MVEGLRRRAFIGRGAELARLRAALEATVAERSGRTVVVGGEAGIGKSRLIEQFATEAGTAARILEGACLEAAGEGLPYGPFAEVLRELVRATPAERLPAVLGPARSELTRLLPELATRAADLRPAASAEPDRASQARLFELILGVLERLAAERPVVLIVEDVHWADRSTRELLGFLSRALRDEPALIVLTTRTDASGTAVGNLGFLAELEREEHVERLELRPFDRDEVAEQAAALLGEPPGPGDIDRLFVRTDGNPFYVEELILAAETGTGLPPVLRDVLAARVTNLSAGAREVLRAAAAAGRRIDDELLAGVLGMSPRDLAAALREAFDSGILLRQETPDGPASAFRHALLLEAVADELFPGERVALHAAFARALEARLASGDGRVSAAEIARHWDGAREPSRALPFTLRAATAAEAAYAFPEALRLWERAAAMLEAGAGEAHGDAALQAIEAGAVLGGGVGYGPRDLAEVLIQAADCAVVTGDPRRAVEHANRALIHLYPTGDRERILTLENRLRWYLWWAGDRAAATAAVERALEAIPAAPPSLERARALAQRAGILMFAGDYEGSRALASEAIEIATRLDALGEIALAYGVLGWDVALLGDVDGGIETFRRGLAIGEALGSVEGVAIAVTNLPALLDRVGRSEDALRTAREGYAVVERLGIARTYGGLLLGYAAKAELALGRWDDAERSTSLGLRRGAVDRAAIWLQVNRARLLTGRGRFAEAAVLLRRARATDARLGGTEFHTAILAAEAELAAWAGRPAEVVAAAAEGLEALGDMAAPDPSLAWLAALLLRAVADAKPGPLPEVVGRVRAAVRAAATRPGFAAGPRAGALIALIAAEEARATGPEDPDAWRGVAEQWAAMRRPFPEAYARYREAEAILASRGARDAAVAALGRAAEIASRLEAAPLAGLVARLALQARITLPGGGSDPSPAVGGDPYGFTAREGEVLRLVVGGWTNQQIADALFITRKTASVHVSNILAKLGAENRGEAAAMAHRLGLVPQAEVPAPPPR